MIKPSNIAASFTIKATWFRGLPTYGKIMINDQLFIFYNERNVKDFVQIPWREVTYVIADVHFRGRYIPRFEVKTRKNGSFIFSTRENKRTLRAIRDYIPADHLRRAWGLGQKIKRIFVKKHK